MNYNQVSNLQNCCRCANPIGFCYHAGPCNYCSAHQQSRTATNSAPVISIPSVWSIPTTEKTPFLKIQKVENGYVVTHNGKEYVFESLIGIAYHFEPPTHSEKEEG